MKLAKHKSSNRASESRICCLCHRSIETHQTQRQHTHLRKQDFAASAEDPMKPTKHKGSTRASEAGFCCLHRRLDETR